MYLGLNETKISTEFKGRNCNVRDQMICLKILQKITEHTNMEMQQLLEETTQNQIRRLKRKRPEDLCE